MPKPFICSLYMLIFIICYAIFVLKRKILEWNVLHFPLTFKLTLFEPNMLSILGWTKTSIRITTSSISGSSKSSAKLNINYRTKPPPPPKTDSAGNPMSDKSHEES